MSWFHTEALIFDMDGTLADSMPVHYRAWQVVCQRYALSFPYDKFQALGGVPTRQTLEILQAEQGGRFSIDEACALKESAMEGQLESVSPVDEVIAIARWGREQGMPLGVATGASRDHAEITLSALGIRDWFDAVATADDVDRFKPEPNVFLVAAKRLGVQPAKCAAFEDTDIGLQAIRAAGMKPFDVRLRLPAIPA